MSLAGTKLSKIKKLIAQVEKISDVEDPTLSFEFLIGSLYPEVYGNVSEGSMHSQEYFHNQTSFSYEPCKTLPYLSDPGYHSPYKKSYFPAQNPANFAPALVQ